ncbi:PP2C family protein-serine/threonine phosphatase [Geosporobacter ferrireducens]|uniref:PP2C family protein-serine/threonine phosphatase n=1 Tax=Geosporobacter ferrireducens TaxID=1424294 RepID=UPI002356459C|nr:PP2C family protein-serine/threonine phosphatase [Geosporobacter ferrireducens]
MEVVRTEDGMIVVLSDGLGSGVKAHILATMTAKIAATMLKEGLDITEVVDTIVNTLPICQVRKIAYSTFTIVYVRHNGEASIIQFDNPPIFYYDKEGNQVYKNSGVAVEINGKKVYQSKIQLQKGDCVIAVSDGVIHAGLGVIFNLGWTWENVAQYLNRLCPKHNSLYISKALIATCRDLYDGKPGDDTTAVAIQLKEPKYINLFTGPPLHKENDAAVVQQLVQSPGKKIICGGTAANIVARELNCDMQMDLTTVTAQIPPITHMKGFELVTEGILTLRETLEQLKLFHTHSLTREISGRIKEKNGAAMLTQILLYDCTHVNFFVGRAVNPAHQSQDAASAIPMKLRIVGELINMLKKIGKVVYVHYY